MNAGWGDGDLVIGFLLILVIVWIIVGFIGFVVHGLFWLFVIACFQVLFTLIGGAFGRGRRSARPRR